MTSCYSHRGRAAYDLDATGSALFLLVFFVIAVPRWRKACGRPRRLMGKRTALRLQRCCPGVLQREERRAAHSARVVCNAFHLMLATVSLGGIPYAAAATTTHAALFLQFRDNRLALKHAVLRSFFKSICHLWRVARRVHNCHRRARRCADGFPQEKREAFAAAIARIDVLFLTAASIIWHGPSLQAGLAICIIYAKWAGYHCQTIGWCRVVSFVLMHLLLTWRTPLLGVALSGVAAVQSTFGVSPTQEDQDYKLAMMLATTDADEAAVSLVEESPPQANVVARLRDDLPQSWGQHIVEQMENEYGAAKAAEMLNADWSAQWQGWKELKDQLLGADMRGDFWEVAPNHTTQCLRQFLRLADQNKDVRAMTEESRLEELKAMTEEAPLGLVRGTGSAFGRNCCADSLLQLLIAEQFLPPMTLTEREALCEGNRDALRGHENPDLRPKRRDPSTNAVICEDGGAYLQHDIHADATLRYFMMCCGDQQLRPLPAEGIQLNVYSRLDSEEIPYSCDYVCQEPGAGPPSVVFHLYNLTGEGTSGYHYDPMFNVWHEWEQFRKQGRRYRFPMSETNDHAEEQLRTALAHHCPTLPSRDQRRAASALPWFLNNDYPWFDAARREDSVRFAEICKCQYHGEGEFERGVGVNDAFPHMLPKDIDAFQLAFRRQAWAPLEAMLATWDTQDEQATTIYRGSCFDTVGARDKYLADLSHEGMRTPTSCSTKVHTAIIFASQQRPRSHIYYHLNRHGYHVPPSDEGLLCVFDRYVPIRIGDMKKNAGLPGEEEEVWFRHSRCAHVFTTTSPTELQRFLQDPLPTGGQVMDQAVRDALMSYVRAGNGHSAVALFTSVPSDAAAAQARERERRAKEAAERRAAADAARRVEEEARRAEKAQSQVEIQEGSEPDSGRKTKSLIAQGTQADFATRQAAMEVTMSDATEKVSDIPQGSQGPQEAVSSGASSQCDEGEEDDLSEISDVSDDSDIFHVEVLRHKT